MLQSESTHSPSLPSSDPHGPSSVAAIVLAGSYAWTGSTFERLRPRPLLPVGQAPLIVHVLRSLERAAVSQATICANGATPSLKAHFAQSPFAGVNISFYEDGSPRGAAGCVFDAARSTDAETLIVTDCSVLPDLCYEKLLAQHRDTGAALTIVVTRDERAGAKAALNPTGLYVIERRVLHYVGAQGYQDIKESLVPQLHRAGETIATFETEPGCPTVLNAHSYLDANRWMTSRVATGQAALGNSRDYRRSGDVVAHVSARIDESASLVGPVIVGADVRIEAGAVVIGPTTIGDGSVIRARAVVSRSVIWSGTEIGADALVDQSIVADNTVIPDGSQLHGSVRTAASETQRPLLSRLRGPAAPARRPQPVTGLAMSSVR
jgi:mannose-1-phosphate guanylyltransferase/phosphomannomutase